MLDKKKIGAILLGMVLSVLVGLLSPVEKKAGASNGGKAYITFAPRVLAASLSDWAKIDHTEVRVEVVGGADREWSIHSPPGGKTYTVPTGTENITVRAIAKLHEDNATDCAEAKGMTQLNITIGSVTGGAQTCFYPGDWYVMNDGTNVSYDNYYQIHSDLAVRLESPLQDDEYVDVTERYYVKY